MSSEHLSAAARTIFEQALADCSVAQAVAKKVAPAEGTGPQNVLLVGRRIIAMNCFKRVRVIAIGKAAPSMLTALLSHLPLSADSDLTGVMISQVRPMHLPKEIQFFAGGHPLPNEESFAGARAVLAILQGIPKRTAITPDTLCLFLISGGASSMMELPLDPDISLQDTIGFNRALVHCGASIAEINCVRKHFSAVKGGRLAIAAKEAESISLLISDVPSGHLDTIASGPTLPDSSTTDQCREILSRYRLLEQFSGGVRRFFESNEIPETPKPQGLATQTVTLLDANDLAEAASKRAQELGFYVVVDNSCDDWDYRAASEYLLARIRLLRREHGRVCLISVGEVTVSLPSRRTGIDRGPAESSVGGRNQHFALYAATLLTSSDEPIAVLSAGSDGIDGNSIAAGAVVNEETICGNTRHGESRIDEAQLALQQFRSFEFLERIGAAIITGPTGNNLRDLRILLAEPSGSLTL